MSPETPPPPPPPFSSGPAFNPAAPRPSLPPRTSGAAVTSLVLGLASLVCSCFTALPGLICGVIGLSNIGRSNGQLKGRGMAILGIILSLLLPLVGAAAWYQVAGKDLQRAGVALFKSVTYGSEIAAALQAHADAHNGRLPGSLDEVVAAGGLEASSLVNPLNDSPGFWNLVQPGAELAALPGKTVIARGGPIAFQGQSLEVAILADGTVTPQQAGTGGLDELPTPIPVESGESAPAPEAPVPADVPAGNER